MDTPATTAENPTLHVFTNCDQEWWVAETIEAAMAQHRKDCGSTATNHHPENWRQLDDASPLTIRLDPECDAETRVTKTCAEWAAEASGPCLLCAVDY